MGATEEPSCPSTDINKPQDSEDHEYPSTAATITIIASTLTAMFLVSLDRTIISTAIPYITDHFHSIDDIGWYGSTYLLSNAALQLLYGRLYKFYNARSVFICSIGLFEIGSAVCGAAPNSPALIIGRAIAGAGSAGVLGGAMQIIVFVAPLEKRPIYTSMFASINAISAVVSPSLAGALTERVSWRWCFYINLPFAAVSVVAVFFLLKTPPSRNSNLSFQQVIQTLDLTGLFLFVPCIVSLILALQWGGSTYAWSNGRVIALWVGFGITLIAWVFVQAWKKENATVPGRIFFQRSILAGFLFSASLMSSMMLLVYYVPMWFQAIKGASPVDAGLSFIPFLLSIVIASTLGGLFTQRIGYYVPTMILACILGSIGTGLMMTIFAPDTEHPTWIGLQVLTGFGIGLGLQQSILAAQTVLPAADIPIGMAVIFFGQLLGGTVFLSVGESVFSHVLRNGLKGIPGLGVHEAEKIASSGATEFRHLVSASMLAPVLKVYNSAITHTWYVSLALTCASIAPALFMEWRSIKSKKSNPNDECLEKCSGTHSTDESPWGKVKGGKEDSGLG